jgi:hypothetical protein
MATEKNKRTLTPMMEQYCQLRARGMQQTAAARRAGYAKNSAKVTAHRLEQDPLIRERIAQLTERARQRDIPLEDPEQHVRTGISKDWIRKMLLRNALEAMEAGSYSAANRALELLGKDAGMFQEPKRDMPPDGDLSKLTDQQLDAWIEYFARIAYPDPAEREKAKREALAKAETLM